MNNWVIKLRIVLWLTLSCVVSLLLYLAVIPTGHISYSSAFIKKNFFIGELSPRDRVEFISPTDKTKHAAIIGEPIYFSLYTPRRFNKAKLVLTYKRKSQEVNAMPIIEAGVLVDKKIWRYDLKPLDNSIIDELARTWDVIREENLLLLQNPSLREASSSEEHYYRISKFIEDIQNNKIPLNQIALYNYNLDADYIWGYYQKQEKTRIIDYALRGSYQFYTYIKDETLDFKFVFTDINKNKDCDSIDINLYYRNKLIDWRHLDDDGDCLDDGQLSLERSLHFGVKDLPEGVYKIELRVNDDIITKNIETQQKIAFINNLRLAQDGHKNFLIYTDSPVIYVKTTHPSSLQTIKAGKKELKINETYKQFSATIASSSLKFEHDGIIIAGKGVFAFSQNDLFNPSFVKVDNDFTLKQAGVNYILAKYKIPTIKNGWQTAQAEFDISRAYRENYKYNFLISIPGLRADDSINDALIIKEAKIYLSD